MDKTNKNLTEKITKYLEIRQAELEQYIEDFNRKTTEDIETGAFLGGGNQKFNPSDPIVRKAVEICISKGKFSSAILQTYLSKRHGYIAGLAIWLEENGIIGPMNGNKPRDLLISSMEEFDKKTANVSGE